MGNSDAKNRAQTPKDSGGSAAVADVLTVAYPHNHVVSENPLEAKAARVDLARREIALKGLKDALKHASERMKHGKAPGRMKNLPEIR